MELFTKKSVAVGMSILLLTGCAHKEEETVVVYEEPQVIVAVEHEEVGEIPEPIPITFRVTAYCSCEKCCGKWALNRPLDENGEPIVYGASGEELVSGYSVASPLQFGTKIDLDGIGIVEVQDRTAQWLVDEHGMFIVDLYMTDHDVAWEFGKQYIEGVIVE